MNRKKSVKAILGSFKFYKSKSVFVRDLIFALIIVAVPFFIISMVFYNNAKISLEKQITESNNANLLKYVDIIDTMVADADTLAAYISMQNNINFYTWGNSEANVNDVQANIRQLTMTRNYIDSIYVYSEKSHTFLSPTNIIDATALKDEHILDDYNSYENNILSSTVRLRLKNNKYPYFITITRPLLSADKSQKSGAIIININPEKLLNMLGNKKGTDTFMFLDNNNSVICANNYKLVGTNLNVDQTVNKTIYSSINENNIVSVCHSKSFDNWGYALILPINTYIDEFSSLFYNTKSFILFAVLFCLMLTFLIAVKSFGNIRSIMDVFEQNGIYQTQNKKNFNELDFITSNIISQIEINKSMRSKFFEQYNDLQKAQTVALQAQITPHFLRNTLEVINLKAFELLHGTNSVSDMLALLGDMMDSFINSDDYLITIQRELEYSLIYIQLLDVRYSKCLNINFMISNSIKDYHMIKLSLQPLIENAVFHGIKNNPDGRIEITAVEYKYFIIINIDDNGNGIAYDEIKHINSLFEKNITNPSHIGLCNVNKRLKIVFGKEYGLQISVSPLGGLRVSMKFPKC